MELLPNEDVEFFAAARYYLRSRSYRAHGLLEERNAFAELHVQSAGSRSSYSSRWTDLVLHDSIIPIIPWNSSGWNMPRHTGHLVLSSTSCAVSEGGNGRIRLFLSDARGDSDTPSSPRGQQMSARRLTRSSNNRFTQRKRQSRAPCHADRVRITPRGEVPHGNRVLGSISPRRKLPSRWRNVSRDFWSPRALTLHFPLPRVLPGHTVSASRSDGLATRGHESHARSDDR